MNKEQAHAYLKTHFGDAEIELLGIQTPDLLQSACSDLGIGVQLYAAAAIDALDDDSVRYPSKVLATRLKGGYRPQKAFMDLAANILHMTVAPENDSGRVNKSGTCQDCGWQGVLSVLDGVLKYSHVVCQECPQCQGTWVMLRSEAEKCLTKADVDEYMLTVKDRPWAPKRRQEA